MSPPVQTSNFGIGDTNSMTYGLLLNTIIPPVDSIVKIDIKINNILSYFWLSCKDSGAGINSKRVSFRINGTVWFESINNGVTT